MKLCSFLLLFSLAQLTICLGSDEKANASLYTTQSGIYREQNSNIRNPSRKRRRQDADMDAIGVDEGARPRRRARTTMSPDVEGVMVDFLDSNSCDTLARVNEDFKKAVLYKQRDFLLERGMNLEQFLGRLASTKSQDISITIKGRPDAVVWKGLREVKRRIKSFSLEMDQLFEEEDKKEFKAFLKKISEKELSTLEVSWVGRNHTMDGTPTMSKWWFMGQIENLINQTNFGERISVISKTSSWLRIELQTPPEALRKSCQILIFN